MKDLKFLIRLIGAGVVVIALLAAQEQDKADSQRIRISMMNRT